jgi:hypothetical protein
MIRWFNREDETNTTSTARAMDTDPTFAPEPRIYLTRFSPDDFIGSEAALIQKMLDGITMSQCNVGGSVVVPIETMKEFLLTFADTELYYGTEKECHVEAASYAASQEEENV